MRLPLLLLIAACAGEPEPDYQRSSGAFGVSDGPDDPSEGEDTASSADTGNR